MMQMIMNAINQNWFWLGPLLCLSLGCAIIKLTWSILTGFSRELEDATREWKEAGEQGAEIRRQMMKKAM
jgi:hypothetical protein